MSTFKLKSDLPLDTQKELERVLAIDSGLRNSVEAAFLAQLDSGYVYNKVILRSPDTNEIVIARGIGVPTGDSGFAKGAWFMDDDAADGERALYENIGTNLDADWDLVGGINTADLADNAVTTAKILNANVTADKLGTGAVITTKILDANVTLAKLAAGITPSHVVKFAGKHTTAGGAAAEDVAIVGAVAGDIAIVSLQAKGASPVTILTALPATDKITLTFSADPSTDHVVSYIVLRAAA